MSVSKETCGQIADAVTAHNVALDAALLYSYSDEEKAALREGELLGAAKVGGLLMAAQLALAALPKSN